MLLAQGQLLKTQSLKTLQNPGVSLEMCCYEKDVGLFLHGSASYFCLSKFYHRLYTHTLTKISAFGLQAGHSVRTQTLSRQLEQTPWLN